MAVTELRCPVCGLEPVQAEKDKQESNVNWKVYSNYVCPGCGKLCYPLIKKVKN
jgi:acetone carboxylase gamma subunit